jgi:hypothetical protein
MLLSVFYHGYLTAAMFSRGSIWLAAPSPAIFRQIHASRVMTSATSVMKYVRCNVRTSCARVAPALEVEAWLVDVVQGWCARLQLEVKFAPNYFQSYDASLFDGKASSYWSVIVTLCRIRTKMWQSGRELGDLILFKCFSPPSKSSMCEYDNILFVWVYSRKKYSIRVKFFFVFVLPVK